MLIYIICNMFKVKVLKKKSKKWLWLNQENVYFEAQAYSHFINNTLDLMLTSQ